MPSRHAPDLDDELLRLEARLPDRVARGVRWLRQPGTGWVRVPAAVVLVAGGIVGFLPIIGFWMIPLGLALAARDIPPLQPPLARLLAWVRRKWPGGGEAAG
jgi:hypothetical protein